MNARRVLAALAALAAVFAAFAGPLPQWHDLPPTIAPLDLAEWIRDRREDLHVVDLRGDAAYDADRVPAAEPMAHASAAFGAPTAIFVLYGDDEMQVSRAARALRDAGNRNVLQLRGGAPAWRNEVMFPALPDGASPAERTAFARAAELSRYFGGSPNKKGGSKPPPALSRPRGC